MYILKGFITKKKQEFFLDFFDPTWVSTPFRNSQVNQLG